MQNRHVMLCAVTLIIHCSTGASAFSSAESSAVQRPEPFALDSTGTDNRQAASDPLGFDSGLWRAEYLTQIVDESDLPDKQSAIESSGPPIQMSPFGPMPRGKDNTFGSLIYSDNIVTLPIEIPVLVSKTELQGVRVSDVVTPTPAMTDWEYAAVESTRSKTIGFTTSGPSATSAIVGFIGIVIVIGAYVSSGKSNP